MHVILIPGFWLDGSSWDAVVPAVEAAGHQAYPLTLPAMEAATVDRSKITLRDHIDAVVNTIDALPGPVALVGHSGGGAIAYGAADARVDRIAHVVYVDSWPTPDGAAINASLPAENGEVPLPDWSMFDDEDLVDLDDEMRAAFRARAIPTPEHVTRDPIQLSDERRRDIPATVIACEFPSAKLRDFAAQGMSNLQELTRLRHVDYIDLPTGHWPQFTKPAELAAAINQALS